MQRQVRQWALVVVTHDEQATDAQSLIAANEGIRFVDHDQFLQKKAAGPFIVNGRRRLKNGAPSVTALKKKRYGDGISSDSK
jgi:hypothetical protein